MLDSQKNPELPRSLENIARGLLATTCLTVACGAGAVAGTVTEPIGDFPNTEPGLLLPVGTTIVNGFAGYEPGESGYASPDWFEFQGLTAGDTYTLTAVYDPLGPFRTSGNGESGLTVSVFTSSQSALFSNKSMEGAGVSGANALMGTVPGDGKLDIDIASHNENAGSYFQVTLTQNAPSSVPEPGTLAGAGLALAGALAWSRKRRQ
jgi:hypothetical protein